MMKTVLILFFTIVLNDIHGQNGYVKQFESKNQNYIGSIDGKHLFFIKKEVKKKSQERYMIKVCGSYMDSINSFDAPFPLNGTARIDVINNMILYSKINLESIKNKYRYEDIEIKMYKLDNDTLKQEYTNKSKKIPNAVLMGTKKSKNSTSKDNIYSHLSKNRVAFLFNILNDDKGLDNNQGKYLIIFDNNLKLLFEGLIDLKGEEEEVDGFIINNNNIVVHVSNEEHKYEELAHFVIDNSNNISKSRIEIPKHYKYDYKLSFSPSGEYLAGSFFYTDKKPTGYFFYPKELLGEGVFKYSLKQKQVEKVVYYDFDKLNNDDKNKYHPVKLKSNYPPIWTNGEIILIEPKLKSIVGDGGEYSYQHHDGKFVTKIGTNYAGEKNAILPSTFESTTEYRTRQIKIRNTTAENFSLKYLDNNLNIDSVYNYKMHIKPRSLNGVNNFFVYFDQLTSKYNILYKNSYRGSGKEDNLKDEDKGSHIVQVSFEDTGLKKTYIELPDKWQDINLPNGFSESNGFIPMPPKYNQYLFILIKTNQ